MARSTVAHPAEIVTLDGPVTDVTESFLGWERFAVPDDRRHRRDRRMDHAAGGLESRRKYPVLLNVHGGPLPSTASIFDEAQMQAAAGFVVLMCNPRGGSGRDTAWGQSILGTKHPVAPGTGWVDHPQPIGELAEIFERRKIAVAADANGNVILARPDSIVVDPQGDPNRVRDVAGRVAET